MDKHRSELIPRWFTLAATALPVSFITLFYIFPVEELFRRVLSWNALDETFSTQGLGSIVAFTFAQASISTVCTLLIGIGPTYLLSQWDFRGKTCVRLLITIPFMLPTVVVSTAFIALLPPSLSHTTTSIIIVHVFFNVAVIVRIVGSAWSNLPEDMNHAARTLGASPWKTWKTVILPLLRPAILSACAIVFLFTFTSFGVIKLVGNSSHRTIETEIARYATYAGNIDVAVVLSCLQIIFLALAAGALAYFSRKGSHQFTHATRPRRPRTLTQKVRVYVSALCLSVIFAIPIIVLITKSFRVGNHWSMFAWKNWKPVSLRPGVTTGTDISSAITTSLQYAVVAVLITFVLAACAALSITFLKKKGVLIDTLSVLPLATSAVTIAFGILLAFSREPFDWRASWWLIPIGHSLIALPFAIRIVLPILQSRPHMWLRAAATLGGSPLRALWSIDGVRMIGPLTRAAGITAAISLGEFGATTLLSRSGTTTIPLAIADLLSRTGEIPRAQAYMLSSLLAIITAGVIVIVEGRHASR